MEKFLRGCTLIMTSTPPLTASSRSFNCNVMEAIYGLRPPERVDHGRQPYSSNNKVRLGFFGENEGINAPFMIEALKELKRCYQHGITLEIIGLKANDKLKGVVDSFFDAVRDCDGALRLLKSRQWDIGLAPLSDTEFNSAKQVTKFRDYAWCGAAMVASDVPTYRRAIVDGIHGILVENTPKAWVEGIVSLIEDREKRKFVATGASRLLENIHMQDKTIASWYQLVWRIMKFKADRFAEPHPTPVSTTLMKTPQHEIVESPRLPSVGLSLRGIVAYRLTPRHPNWTGVDVLVRADRRKVGGLLNLCILSETGQVLRKTQVRLASTHDGDWLEFRFNPIANSGSVLFTLKFALTDEGGGNYLKEGIRHSLWPRQGQWLPEDKLYCRLRYGNNV
jgi:hypothetical protein